MSETSNGAPSAPAAQTAPGSNPATEPNQIPGSPGQPTGAAGNDAVKAAAAEAIRKHKLKVDGQEIEVDDEELKRGYTHQKAANKKLQEGIKYRKQAEEFVTAMKDPSRLVDTLQKMGWEPKQIRDVAEQYLAGVLEDEMLDPKEREFKTTKQKLQEFEKKEAARIKAEEDAQNEKLKKKYADDYSREFIQALQENKMHPSKANVASMAGYIARAAKIKMPMTANEAAKLVQQDIDARDGHRFKEADAESILKIIGEDGLKKIREYDVKRLKDPSQHLKVPEQNSQGAVRKRDPAAQRMTQAEWRAFNRK